MNRIQLVKKYANKKERPTEEELKEAYGYLDFCYFCRKEFTAWDRWTFNIEHSMLGNSHRRMCLNEEDAKKRNKEIIERISQTNEKVKSE